MGALALIMGILAAVMGGNAAMAKERTSRGRYVALTILFVVLAVAALAAG